MKKISLLLAALCMAVISYAQTPTPTPDTAKRWTIHGENTFLISQS